MKGKSIEKIGFLALISFVLVIIGLTFVEVYAKYYSFLSTLGWIMLLFGLVGLIAILIYNKIKKINLSNFYAKEKIFSWWSVIILITLAFFGISYGFGVYSNGPDYMTLRMYVSGFGAAFMGFCLLILIVYIWINKKK